MSRRAGFTLIELLVALVIGGVVVGSIFQMISGQGRFVGLQSAREEVQQNSRAALELIGSELRTVPGGDALVYASHDSLTLRAPRIWGVICAVSASGTLDLLFPAVAGANYAVNTGTGVVVRMGSGGSELWTDAVRVHAIGSGSGECAGLPVEPGTERRSLTLTSHPQSGGAAAEVGDVAYLYDEVTYRTGTSVGVPGHWIQRRIGDSGNQPMAGPIRPDGEGLRFEYYSAASPSPLPTPISDAAGRRSVARIQVMIESIGRHGGTEDVVKADTVMVSLRNRL